MTPWLTVIIPVFKRLHYLQQCVESVLSQIPFDGSVEVLIHSDGASVDFETIEALFPPGYLDCCRYVKTVEVGPERSNLNRAQKVALGEWVHIVHDDDYVLPGFYDAVKAAIADPSPSCIRLDPPEARRPLGAVAVRYEIVDEWGDVTPGVRPVIRETPGLIEDFCRNLCVTNYLQVVSVVFNKAAFESVGGWREDLKYGDWYGWVMLADKFDFTYVPEVLCHYRDHQGSMTSGNTPDEHLQFAIDAIEAMEEGLGPRRGLRMARCRHVGKFILDAERLLSVGDDVMAGRLIEGVRSLIPTK